MLRIATLLIICAGIPLILCQKSIGVPQGSGRAPTTTKLTVSATTSRPTTAKLVSKAVSVAVNSKGAAAKIVSAPNVTDTNTTQSSNLTTVTTQSTISTMSITVVDTVKTTELQGSDLSISPANLATYATELKSTMMNVATTFNKLSAKMQQFGINQVIHPGDATTTKITVSIIYSTEKNKTFYIYSEPELTYDGAFASCKTRGLLLLSIEDEATSTALETVFPSSDTSMYWTSGNDIVTAMTFVWKSSGRPMSFRNFFAGEPNNSGGSERCVAAGRLLGSTVVWVDTSCNDRKKYVCEQAK